MATTFEVTCVRRTAPSEALAPVGGEVDGRPWSKTESEVVADLDNGRADYVVRVGLRTAKLRVDRDCGQPRLVTALDATAQFLLSLPDCG